MKRVGIGVLGVGEMGRRHAENVRRLVPGAELIAVADVAPGRAKQTAEELEIERSFNSLDSLLECKEVDAVVIATPDAFHAQSVMAAAKAGKHILCEKPLAIKLEDAYVAVEAAKKAKVQLQVGFMRRYDHAYAAAMKRIEAGEIGTPVFFKSVGRDKDAPPLAALQSGINGMLFYTNTIHDFDLALWLMKDEVTEVQAYTTVAIRPEVAQYNDVVAGTVNLKYRNGAIGNVDSSAQAVYAYDVRTEVIGSTGSVFIGSVEKTPAVFLSGQGSSHILADHFLSRFVDAYVAEMQDFVESLRCERPVRVGPETGIESLAIAIAAENSHKQQGKPVKVVSERSGAAG